MMRIIGFTIALAVLAAACHGGDGGESATSEGAGGPGVLAAEDSCAIHTWASVGAPFVYTWCTPCHSSALSDAERQDAPVGTNFDHEQDVVASSSLIMLVMGADSSLPMPPAGGAPPEEVDEFLRYLSCLEE
jgi:uncharacterized membrane protein